MQERRTNGKWRMADGGWAAVLFTALFLTAGCDRGDRPELGTVSGTVTLDGRPLPYALLEFQPERGRISYGCTDSVGRYRLIYIRNIGGAKVGRHSVSISTLRQAEASGPDGKPIPASPELVPKKYNTETTLRAEVKAGNNTFDFALQSK